jgi:cell division protein FtsZ
MDFFNKDEISKMAAEAMPSNVGSANIKVIGCGGAGSNMVNWLYQKGLKGAEIIACNTDIAHLQTIKANKVFLLGKELTRGLGCGGFPEKGREAAKEAMSEIKDCLKGVDMVFVCAGMGGGTGTGSAPEVAKVAYEAGAIVIGTVTMPFKIERARIDKAQFGLEQLRKVADTVIVIYNNRLCDIAGNLPVHQAFAVANELIATMVRGIVETIAIPSLVNLDFADVRAIMKDGGLASIGVGFSDTNNRVQEAVNGAITNPLLDVDLTGGTGALIHIEGGHDMTLDEVNKIGELVTEKLDEDANVIWGARVNKDMNGKIQVMTIVTGLGSAKVKGPTINSTAQRSPAKQANYERSMYEKVPTQKAGRIVSKQPVETYDDELDIVVLN